MSSSEQGPGVQIPSELPLVTSYDIVAGVIGEGVSGREVAEILAYAHEHELLFHGVKRVGYIEGVRRQGVLPLTPECRGSYWATGNQLFFEQTPTASSAMWGYNTAFFHYAPAYNPDGPSPMALAVTDLKRLADAGLKPIGWKPDGECTIDVTVEPSLLTLCIVAGHSERSSRTTAFRWLLDGARSGYLLQSGESIID